MRWSPRILVLALMGFCPAALPAEMLFKGSLVVGDKPVSGATLRLLAAGDRAQDLESYFSDVAPEEIGRTRSDRAGRCELAAPAEGFYRLVVEAEGYLGAFYPLMIFGRENVSLYPISLVAARRARLGVFGPQGEKIAGARVRVVFERDGGPYPIWPQLASTGEDGGLSLLLPRETEAKVLISAGGFPLHEQRLDEGPAAFEARLAKGAAVEVEVADARRRPLPGVTILPAEGAMALGRSGRDGRAVVHLAAGQRELLFMDGEGRRTTQARPAAAPEAPAAPWRVELPDPPLLTGRVVELPGGLPLAEAWVYVPGRFPRFTRSDRAGYFEMVAPRTQGGGIHLVAAKGGFVPATVEVSALSPALTLGLEPAAILEGRVVDTTGRGVAGARVIVTAERGSPIRARGPSAIPTDRDGRFVLSSLVAGEVLEIHAILARVETPTLKLQRLEPGERRNVELVLPQRESWTCVLVDPEGKPVPQATLHALPLRRPGRNELSDALFWMHLMGEGIDLGRSDPEGRIRVDSLAAGLYLLGARAPGFAPVVRRSVRLGAAPGEKNSLDAAGELEIEMRPAATARGQVVDENGKGLAGVRIYYNLIDPADPGMVRIASGGIPVTKTGERGEFEFQEVEASQRIHLLAHKEGYREAALADVAVGDGPWLLTLRRSGRLTGQILAEGKPRAGLRLRARSLERGLSEQEAHPSFQGISDAEGRFSLEGFGPGRYHLEVDSPPGFQPWKSELAEIAGGSEQKIAIELEKAVVVTGRVLLGTGEPVEGASVVHGRSDREGWSGQHESRTDNLGRYRIETAGPGPGLLRVFSLAHGESSKRVDLAADVNEIDLTIEAGQLEMDGRVMGPDGEPLEGADVQVYGDLVRQGTSGQDGRIGFVALRPGHYLVTILKEGFLFPPQQLELKRSQEFVWRLEKAPEPPGVD